VLTLILFACLRYRKRTDELPRQVRYNLPVEVLYTVVPFVIIAVLFYYTVLSQNYVNELSTDEATGESTADVNIGVVGFQWNWQFNYVDDDVQVIGETNRPAQLVLPTDRTIRFTNTSPTSSTRSGCRTSCSSATSSRAARTPSSSPCARRASSSAAAPSCAARSTRS
jgi:heme/copper-type cytochrome/quinol oxidase subunit 2